MKRRVSVIACVLLAGSFLVWMLFGYTSPLAAKFAGTYAAGSGSGQILFSVDPESHEFFYADQLSGTYIRGEFEERGEHEYFLFYPDDGQPRAVPSQTVTCKDARICVTINGEEVLLEKISDVPTIIGDKSRYS